MRSSGWIRELRGGRLLALPVLVVGLLAVTALASREHLSALGKTRGGAAYGGFQVNVSPWQFALIAGGALIAFAWLVIYSGWSRRTPMEGSLRRLLLRFAVLLTPLVAALLIAAALQGLHRRAPLHKHHLTPSTAAGPPSVHPSTFTVPGWVTWAIVGTLSAMALLVTVGSRARPNVTLPSAVESAITAALVDLDAIEDPRLAIIAAYRRMEESLAEAGFPRAAAEAPREYMGRTASALEIDPNPLGTLTTLFETAKFSLRQLDATARQRAITALRALQAQLA